MGRRKRTSLTGKPVESVEDQERRLMSKLEVLIDKLDNFEERTAAYKMNRLDLTRKAIAFQLEKNRRIRDRNVI